MNVRYPSLKIALLVLSLSLSGGLLAAEQTWIPNFEDSDIQQVIKFMAEATGKTIIIDPKVRGPVKLINTRPLNSEELYAMFLSVLDVHGYTAVESGNVVRIVPNRDARSLPVPNQSIVTEVDDTYITQVIQLKNISAAKVLPVLRPLVPQHGHIAAYDSSNALIITDTRANIIRLNEIIAKIDQSAVLGTDLIELRYAQATEVVSVINQLEKPDPNRGTASSPVLVVADKRINGVIVSGDDLQRQRIRVLVDSMDRPQTKNSNFRVYYLRYAKAEEVAKVLTGMMQSLAPTQGAEGGAPNAVKANVQSDEATNSVLITADSDTMESLLAVVESLDIRRAQVLVEAIIVEISGDAGRELGVQWMYRNNDSGFGSSTQGDSMLGAIGAGALDLTENGLKALAGGLSSIPGQVFGVGRIGQSNTDFLGILKMLQSNSSSNILSTPNLLTTDNNKAMIKVGQEVPIATGSYSGLGTAGGGQTNPFNTYNRKDVGILLEVTPHVNEGNTVVLDIKQEVSSIANIASIDGVVTNKREIETQILVADGQTAVLGGLIKDDVQRSETRVPLLGSIPIIGHAFRSQSSRAVKTNLLVFIRASIIRDDNMLTGATADKYRFIRDEQLAQRRAHGILLNSRAVPVIPDWESLRPEATEPSSTSASEASVKAEN